LIERQSHVPTTVRTREGRSQLYWNVVRYRRLDAGVVRRQILYLREINSSQDLGVTRSKFSTRRRGSRMLALFPEDRCAAVAHDSPVGAAPVVGAAPGSSAAGGAPLVGACRGGIIDRFWFTFLPGESEWRALLGQGSASTGRLQADITVQRVAAGIANGSARPDDRRVGLGFSASPRRTNSTAATALHAHKDDLFSHLTERWRDVFTPISTCSLRSDRRL
jgi:hypothetical protein